MEALSPARRWAACGLFLLLALGAGGCRPTAPATARAQEPGAGGAAAAATDGGPSSAARVPLEIEYRSVSLGPTCLSNLRIRVAADGGVYRAVNRTPCTQRGQRWSTPYPEQPQRRLDPAQQAALAAAVEQGGVFDLDPLYARGLASGGTLQELELRLGERHKVVALRDAEPPAAFSALRQRLIDLSR